MNREELANGMMALGCSPQEKRDGYSTRLLRCGCGQHALTAVPYSKDSDEPVKLFGAALSWHMSTGRKGPLTFVLGTDFAGRWKQSLHAIQMIQPKGLEVDLQFDFKAAPALSDVDLSSSTWVDEMMTAARPTLPAWAGRLAASAVKHNFSWYRSVTGQEWSGRLDGLQVCTLSDGDDGRLLFKVGQPGSNGATSKARDRFLNIAAANGDLFEALSNEDSVLLGAADEARALGILEVLAVSEIALVSSQEHRMESRVLREEIRLSTKEGPLQVVREQHPFQFPARWWPKGRPRYVDIMARQGAVPWVVELKVDQSQGEYYRDGLVQTALYREYILRSSGLDRWFAERQMRRRECRAALVVPPLRGTDAVVLRNDHRALGHLLGVDFIEEEAAAAI